MKSRKLFSVLLAAMLILSIGILSSCKESISDEPLTTQQNEEETTDTQATQETEPVEEEPIDPYEKYEEPITLTTVFVSSSAVQEMIVELEGETIEDNRWTKVMKDDLNIDIEYMAIVDESQYDEKVNILVASGQIPDYLYKIKASKVKQMVDGGLVIPVWDLFQDYSSIENKALHNVNRHLNWTAFNFSGEKYAIPNVGDSDTLDNAKILWIRRDWLKALNIEEPKTVEDLDAIIEAFSKDDPDQDGEADTYGLGLLGGDQFLDSAIGYFNSNSAYPAIWSEDDTGKLVYGSNTPAVKNTLEKLHNMYTAGYLDTEFAIKGVQQLSEDVANGKVGMFFGIHASPLLFGFAAAIEIDPNADWISLPIPNPGKASIPAPSSVVEGTIINVKCENPEAIIKMMNVANKYDLLMKDAEKLAYYVTDGHNFVAPLKYPHLPMVNLFSALNTKKRLEGENEGKDAVTIRNEAIEDFYPEDAEVLKEILASNTFGDIIYDLVKPYIDEKTKDNYPWYTIFGPEGSEHILRLYWDNFEERLEADKYLGPITEAMSDFAPTRNKLRSETFIRIIMGEDEISAFDKYTDDISALGGIDIEQEVNVWYENNK